jgi:hypothetical protein
VRRERGREREREGEREDRLEVVGSDRVHIQYFDSSLVASDSVIR